MRRRTLFSLVFGTVLLAGCTIFGPDVAVGADENAVIARYGKPTARYDDGNTTLLEYYSFLGQHTWMIRLDENGNFVSREQVLTVEKFDSIKVGKDDMQAVLRIVGQPSEKSYLTLKDYTVWSYRYKELGIWNSMMHIKFDKDGIVRDKENGLDPIYLQRT